MTRPKGSQNKKTEELNRLQEKVNKLELSNSKNSYQEVVSAFADGYILELTSNIKTISLSTLQTWFNNPDTYIHEISNLLTYYYITDGSIMQLYDLIFSLPKLDYKITTYEKLPSHAEDMAKIKQLIDKKVKHKQLTRDLMVQLAHEGTLIGTWLGNTNKPYYYTFDNLKFVYPYGRYQGEMVGVIDLKWIESMKSDIERESVYANLKPLVTKLKYEKWKNETDTAKKNEMQYITLPMERTLVARTHTLNRNQRLGVPYGTQALFDIQHKNKMKELERSVADKIIRAIAVLKFKGKDENDVKVQEKVKRDVFNKVKKALELNNSEKNNGLTVVGLPDFAEITVPEFKNGDKVLSPDKYESTNLDIAKATGVGDGVTSGTGGNFASSSMNLDTIYKKVGVLLEQIEEIYNQLIIIALGEEKGLNYTFEYNKETPLEKTARLQALMTLQSQGYSTSHVLDELGIDSESYFAESIYEIEVMKLREKITPPMTSFTTTDATAGTKPKKEKPVNDNTVAGKTSGANKVPSPK